jgi:hypothetical protein
MILNASSFHLAYTFYLRLRDEVVHGNPALAAADQTLLRSHYPVMLSPVCHSTK